MAENITAHMDKSLESLKHNFSKVRTGRANANILSDITVDYYGVPTPVTQVAAVKTPEAHMLLIEPWDKALINAIVKAIGASDLGIPKKNCAPRCAGGTSEWTLRSVPKPRAGYSAGPGGWRLSARPGRWVFSARFPTSRTRRRRWRGGAP